MVLYRQDKLNDAVIQLEAAVTLNPDYSKALNALAYIIHRSHGDQNRGRSLAVRAVGLEPRNREFRDTLELYAGSVDNPHMTQHIRPDAIAVVIGNRNYKDGTLPAVKFAAQDAATIKRYLVDSFGFNDNNIFLLNDASYIDFVKLFGDNNNHRGILYNRTKMGRSDIFIYYSGHGAPDTNTRKAYLVPADADPTVVGLTSYSLDTLYDNISKLSKEKNPPSITVVLDSCFSGGSHGGMIIPDASPIFMETTAPLMQAKNTVVFTSAKGNQISSWYPEKNHSLFTYFFLKNLKTAFASGKKLTAADMEKALLDTDGVNDSAWRLYNREQQPQVLGNINMTIIN